MAQIDPGVHPALAAGSLSAEVPARVTFAADLAEFVKTGIVKMVVFTAGVGFAMSALTRNWTWRDLILTGTVCLIGTALSAAGANALNQVMEVPRDARMRRTADRPLPSGRMRKHHGWAIGVGLCVAGVLVLALGNNIWAASVSAVTILSYLLWYTPLKPVTPLATLVGAIPGALPPLIGWAAASTSEWGGLGELGGWSLFLLMFVWQVPHFLALAWKYRDDYALGGHAVLPIGDRDGHRTALAVLFWTLALIPVSLAPSAAMPSLLGLGYVFAAVLSALAFAYTAVRMAVERTDASAIRLFLASIMYLPVVMIAMVADALIGRL
jgi:protoheme IX farnesyltransferase